MRIAVLADIHGNLPALEAVLADLATQSLDAVVNLGDVVSGPLWPAECADRLMPLGLPTISGNHERQLPTQPVEAMSASDRHADRLLRPKHRAWIATFPESLGLYGDVLLVHGTPANDVDYFLHTVSKAGLRPATDQEIEMRAAGTNAGLILCGHTHLPGSIRLSNGGLVLNPGSVGVQAYDAAWPYPHKVENRSPHARYAIVEQLDKTWFADFLSIPYDWETAATMAEKNDRPDWARALRTGIA